MGDSPHGLVRYTYWRVSDSATQTGLSEPSRSIVTSMTSDGGFAPLLINPIDFAAMYRDFKRKNREAAAAKA